MESLSKSLFSVVSQAVDNYASMVATKYSLDKDEVLALWNSTVSSDLKVVQKESAPKRASRAKPSSESSENVKNCSYIFTKGKKINEHCTSKACENSEVCKKHKEKEGKEKVEKKAPKAKKTSDPKEDESKVVKKLNDAKPLLSLKKNKYGNFEHSATKFVFIEATKEVYGRQTENGVVNLTSEDIEECKKLQFKFKIPTTLTGNKEKLEDSEEEVEESEEDIDEEEEDDEN